MTRTDGPPGADGPPPSGIDGPPGIDIDLELKTEDGRVRVPLMITREFFEEQPNAVKEIVWDCVVEAIRQRWPQKR